MLSSVLLSASSSLLLLEGKSFNGKNVGRNSTGTSTQIFLWEEKWSFLLNTHLQ